MRYLALFVVIAVHGCSVVESDPRGQFWGVGQCDALDRGAAFCESKARPWGVRL